MGSLHLAHSPAFPAAPLGVPACRGENQDLALRGQHGTALGDAQATREIPAAVRLGWCREGRIILCRAASESRQSARERERECTKHGVAKLVVVVVTLFDRGLCRLFVGMDHTASTAV